MNKGEFSPRYLDYAKQSDLAPLTNTQRRFAEWLLTDEGVEILGGIGDLDSVYTSVRKYIKTNKI